MMAQAPEAFKYQAVARSSNGEIISNQKISLKIEIKNENSTVYSETHNTETNQYGLINLEVGKGTQISTNDFSEINWANGSQYIYISIDETGGSNFTPIGNAQLLSVPYALFAKTSSNATQPLQWNNDLNENLYVTDQTVGIGREASTDTALVVNGNINISGNIYQNGVLISSSNAYWQNVGSNLYYPNRVTIGSTNNFSASYFQVIDETNDDITKGNGAGMASFARSKDGSSSELEIRCYPNISSLDPFIQRSVLIKATQDAEDLIISPGDINGQIRFFTQQLSPENERLTIDSVGHVGIGVTDPQRSLHIKDVMRLEPRNSEPQNPVEGDIYMDGTTHKLRVYDGSQWQNCW